MTIKIFNSTWNVRTLNSRDLDHYNCDPRISNFKCLPKCIIMYSYLSKTLNLLQHANNIFWIRTFTCFIIYATNHVHNFSLVYNNLCLYIHQFKLTLVIGLWIKIFKKYFWRSEVNTFIYIYIYKDNLIHNHW